MDALGKPPLRKFGLEGVLPGEGNAGRALASLSLDRAIFLGLNNFIFEVFAFGSLSGGGPSARLLAGGGTPGDGNGLLPLGNATLAAVVAASLLPPTVPLL